MIEEYGHVVGEKDGKAVIGIAVDITVDCICIEEDETNEVYMFAPSEVKPATDGENRPK